MHISSTSVVATLVLLSPLTAAANVRRGELEPRDNVAACKAILIALKASQFCSSFVPIKDVTSTETKTGTTGYTKVTVTAACTNPYKKEKRAPSTTPAAPSTTPAAPSTTPRISTTSSTTSRSYTTTTASKCTLKGVQPQVASFGCSVITEACTAFVKPKTVKVSISSFISYDKSVVDSPSVKYLTSHHADDLRSGLHICSWDNSHGYKHGHAHM